jgi:hypothetical protein
MNSQNSDHCDGKDMDQDPKKVRLRAAPALEDMSWHWAYLTTPHIGWCLICDQPIESIHDLVPRHKRTQMPHCGPINQPIPHNRDRFSIVSRPRFSRFTPDGSTPSSAECYGSPIPNIYPPPGQKGLPDVSRSGGMLRAGQGRRTDPSQLRLQLLSPGRLVAILKKTQRNSTGDDSVL